jgi:hypothetical protein
MFYLKTGSASGCESALAFPTSSSYNIISNVKTDMKNVLSTPQPHGL